MTITNQQILDTASKLFREYGQSIFEAGRPGFFEAFTEVVDTDSEENEIDLLGAMPAVREWKGEKLFQSMRAYSASAKLKTYEASFRLPYPKVRYDRTGLLGRRISKFFSPQGSGGQFYDKLATDKLVSNPVGYDNVALFSSAHPHGPSGNQSNVTSSALSFAVHEGAILAVTSLQDEHGEPLGLTPDVLMVGPKNRKKGMEITGSDERLQLAAADGTLDATASGVAAATVPNVFGGGQMQLIVNPRLVGAYDDYCFYFSTSSGVKPILCYDGRKPEPHEQTEMDSEGRFLHNELRFSLEADQAYAAGMWQGSYAIIL